MYSLNVSRAPPGHVWATYSTIAGSQQTYNVSYVLGMQLSGPYALQREDLPALQPGVDHVVVDWHCPMLGKRRSAGAQCSSMSRMDQEGGVAVPPCPVGGIPNKTAAECCDLCTTTPACDLYVHATAENICWLAKGSTGTKASADRSIGCAARLVAGQDCLMRWPAAAASGPSIRTPGSPMACIPSMPNGTFASGLYVVAPVVHGFALLGEVNSKWVTVSPNRFSALTITPAALTVVVSGPAGEQVTAAAVLPSGQVASQSVTIPSAGQALLRFES